MVGIGARPRAGQIRDKRNHLARAVSAAPPRACARHHRVTHHQEHQV
jgi:hypothetical protein